MNPDVIIVLALAVDSEVVNEVRVLVVTVRVEVGVTVMVLVELVLIIDVEVTGMALVVLAAQMIIVVQPLHWQVFGLTVIVLVGVTVMVLVGVTVVVLVGVTVVVLVGVTVMVLVGVTVIVLVGVTVVVLVPVVMVVVMVPDVILLLLLVLVGSGSMLIVKPLISTKVQPYKQNSKLTRLIGIKVGMVQLKQGGIGKGNTVVVCVTVEGKIELVFVAEVMVELVEADEVVEVLPDVVTDVVIVEFMKVDEDMIMVEFTEEVIVELVIVVTEDEVSMAIFELILVLLEMFLLELIFTFVLLLADTRPMAKADMIKMIFDFMLLTTKCSTGHLFILDHNIWLTKLLLMATKLLLLVSLHFPVQITIKMFMNLFIINGLNSLYWSVLRSQNKVHQRLQEIQAGFSGRPNRWVGYFWAPKWWFHIIFQP